MPTYDHICSDEICGFEWEAEYSIKDDPPTICPRCKKETAKRMISSATPGVVELYGQELMSKLKADGVKIRNHAYKSEKAYASLLGDDKYQAIQQQMDKNKRER